jgi:hypothetical protein
VVALERALQLVLDPRVQRGQRPPALRTGFDGVVVQ